MPAHPSGVLHAIPSPVWLPYPDDVNALLPDLWPRSVRKDSSGHLTVAGHGAAELSAGFGTPVQIFDVGDFRSRIADFCESFAREFAQFGFDATGFYAGKAFLCTAVAAIVADSRMGLDTCSLGELMIARAGGMDPQRVGLHGNNKSLEEIEFALRWGIGRIVVDSLTEVDLIASTAARLGVTAPVMVRVTLGVEAHTHDFIATSHEDQKFGLSLHSGAALAAVRAILDSDSLELVGLHSHIGSQIFDEDGFSLAASRIMQLREQVAEETGHVVPEIDLGGGFGIKYTSQDRPSSFTDMARSLAGVIRTAVEASTLPPPRISFEPGRAVVGPAMFTLYTVGTVKPVETGSGTRLYVSVDGGMSDNIRAALYDADYSCTLANRASDSPPAIVRVVGRHCESGDIVVRDEYLPADVASGDLVAVPGTGAYCRPLASNYNQVPRPGVLAVEDGNEPRWIVRPETYADLFATDPGFPLKKEGYA